MTTLKDKLRTYRVELEYFDPDDPACDIDAITMSMARDTIDKELTNLSKEETEELKKLDLLALNLYEQYKTHPNRAIKVLKHISMLAKNNLNRK